MPRPAHLSAGVLGSAGLVGLCVLLPAHVRAARPEMVVPNMPRVEDVVMKEGFAPTLSQSETYRPGVVLVKNAMGTHDEVVEDCLGVPPTVKIMSQSSIATSLSAGVSARLAVARGEASAGIEKRLSFVDPEQRSIPLAKVQATEACRIQLSGAARLVDLTEAIVVYDVLVARIQNVVCTRTDAKGGVVALGDVEAASYEECVQESDAQVPLGFKAIPLAKVLAQGGGNLSQSMGASPAGQTGPAAVGPAVVRSNADFANPVELGVAERLRLQACEDQARTQGDALRAARLVEAEANARGQASAAWAKLREEAEGCVRLPLSERSDCIDAVEKWLSTAQSMELTLEAGEEPVATDCGERRPVFQRESRTVVANEVLAARSVLARLSSADTPAASPQAPAAGTANGDKPVSYKMIAVLSGTYELGCTKAQSLCKDDEIRHTVKLTRPFYLGRTEVTQGLWVSVMGTNPSRFTACGDDCPVDNVSWVDAAHFANALSAKEGLQQCYTINNTSVRWSGGPRCTGYRLPTEAEWEVAARGIRDTAYAGGDSPASVAWFRGPANFKTHPVMEKGVNSVGFYDMSGNVCEWVWDAYGAYPSNATDPTGSLTGTLRICRGGAWNRPVEESRVIHRSVRRQDEADAGTGFRLARSGP